MRTLVSIETVNPGGNHTVSLGNFLLLAFTHTADGENNGRTIKVEKGRFSFTTTPDDFRTLVRRNAFPPSMVTAFEDAARTSGESKATALWKKGWSFLRDEARAFWQPEAPLSEVIRTVPTMPGVQIAIRRYGYDWD